MNPTSDTMATQAGTWIHRSAEPNAAGVAARIMASSNPAMAAVATANTANSRLAQASLCRHQM